MRWQEGMIYDRTLVDVTNRTAKAFFNVSDWLRIFGNSKIANQLLNVYLSLAVPFTELSAPTITTFPAVADINTLIQNIDLVRAAAYLPVATGIVALKYDYVAGNGATAPDYTSVNAWEQDIQLIRDYLISSANYLINCGVGTCGQVRFWQVQFRSWIYVSVAGSPVRRPRCGIVSSGSNLMRQTLWRKY